MWVFTQKGFLSAVIDGQKKGNMLVRFRDLNHAAAFIDAAYKGEAGRRCQIRETPRPADYRWKASMPLERFIAGLSNTAEAIDYRNFKGRCQTTRAYDHNDLHDVWEVMNNHQTRAIHALNAAKDPIAWQPEPELFPDIEPSPRPAGYEGEEDCQP